MCADECVDDEVMIPELEERDEIENCDTVNTRSNQSGSDEKTPNHICHISRT
jgi:hypothetical protein